MEKRTIWVKSSCLAPEFEMITPMKTIGTDLIWYLTRNKQSNLHSFAGIDNPFCCSGKRKGGAD